MRTNIPHIYACGDVNGLLPFTHVAGYEGGIAVANAVLHLPRKADYGKIGWCTYTDPEVASIGLNEKRAAKEGIAYRIFEAPFAENDRAIAEGETAGKIKLLVSKGGKLIGCQMIGPHAGELIHEWVIALNAGVRLSTMAGTVHIYPTLAEISKRVGAGALHGEDLQRNHPGSAPFPLRPEGAGVHAAGGLTFTCGRDEDRPPALLFAGFTTYHSLNQG